VGKMPEYLPITQSRRRTLGMFPYRPKGDDTLSIHFQVENPGRISAGVDVLGLSWGSPIKCKIEILKPGISTPVSETTIDSPFPFFGKLLWTTYNVQSSEAGLSGDWIARVTHLQRFPRTYRLSVTYPGTIEVKTQEAPSTLIDTFVNSYIKPIKIHVTNGSNASYIDFPSNLGVADYYFTVPDFNKEIRIPWAPDITIRERANNINSKDITFSLNNPVSGYSNGFIRLVITFEEVGKEILGTFDCHLSNMILTIDLGLESRNYQISYNRYNVNVTFSCNVNIVNVPDFLEEHVLDPILGYTDTIEQEVRNKVRVVFERESTRQAFATAITNQMSSILGPNPQILSVTVENNQLKIRYYNA